MEVGATFFVSVCTKERIDATDAAAKKKAKGAGFWARFCLWFSLHIHLTTAEIIHSLTSLLDWASDFYYVFDVLIWIGAGYVPSKSQVVDCVLALQGQGHCTNGTWAWTLDGARFDTTAGGDALTCCDAEQINTALMDTCQMPRKVDVPGHILFLLIFGAAAGVLSDIVKTLLAHRRVR